MYKRQAWQQAKNELIAGSVSVSERGMEVAQAGDPFSARIDNRQFLIHNTDTGEDVASVSYTHLDVYKRQPVF